MVYRMKRRKKKKINYFKVLLAIFIILIIIFLIYKIINRPKEPVKILMIDTINRNINEVESELNEYNLDINIEYKYDDNIDKDKIISQSITKDTEINNGDRLDLVVSLGKIDKDDCKMLIYRILS